MKSSAPDISASEVDRIVGERIRRRRILTGLTQDQLGEALGVSYQQIQKYETGANRVSAGRLYLHHRLFHLASQGQEHRQGLPEPVQIQLLEDGRTVP